VVGVGGSNPHYITAYNGFVYYAGEGNNGMELWRSDGVTVELVMDVQSGSASGEPRFLTTLTAKNGDNEKLFFVANKDVRGFQMWVHDGVAGTTKRAFTQTSNEFDVDVESMDMDAPAKFGILDGAMYYSANEGQRNWLSPSGLSSEDKEPEAWDGAFMIWDNDFILDPTTEYDLEMNCTKGVLKVMFDSDNADVYSGRGSDVLMEGDKLRYSGTLKNINNLARNVLYFPAEGENGWAEFTVKVVDSGADKSCDTCYKNEAAGKTSIYISEK